MPAQRRNIGSAASDFPRSLLLCLCLLAGGARCEPSPSFSADIEPLLRVSCALGSCHGSAEQGRLSLSPSGAYCSLVGQRAGATFRDPARAGFPRRVVPGSREESFLYKKLTLPAAESGPSKPLGEVMPPGQGQPSLDKSYIELFGKWIDAGARDENGAPAPGACP